ncbi:hypothetical protein BRM22_14910 [Xanthomonas oryzae pv. oryzae]|uniref:EamA domain-containing protein n=2 Tax=Xanthomonas oryzae pv. oryzae TaxID=64187 RepID=Q5GXH5_XANOR|nr:hypothetical protein [Xanthomonas oryzae]AAW76596.1 conserved hypothetical protein [Xanthomonas oryzae pv. oryzae KACC 10331]AJQ82426.1 hypothetical protein AZ54_07135 [Xanthomonas oryzae pv. oryzae PXO86]ALZ71233.1 hypothetical protein APZ20_06690 [Xanthomonas oryzae pv. oryzae]AOS03383.1 hypothetical protein ATY42_16255 [Xanthomonas oryzae pv. oryzae]AOS06765.1 hypothetical protein ATY43_12595 [Xanthomonas oryzae pv. oryzae]
MPVFGALLVWSLLGEPLTWTMLVAAVPILGSVAFSQRARQATRGALLPIPNPDSTSRRRRAHR